MKNQINLDSLFTKFNQLVCLFSLSLSLSRLGNIREHYVEFSQRAMLVEEVSGACGGGGGGGGSRKDIKTGVPVCDHNSSKKKSLTGSTRITGDSVWSFIEQLEQLSHDLQSFGHLTEQVKRPNSEAKVNANEKFEDKSFEEKSVTDSDQSKIQSHTNLPIQSLPLPPKAELSSETAKMSNADMTEVIPSTIEEADQANDFMDQSAVPTTTTSKHI